VDAITAKINEKIVEWLSAQKIQRTDIKNTIDRIISA
jgi:hypothetical protein